MIAKADREAPDHQVALDRLADALAEDVAATPRDALLAEVAEDVGRPDALAVSFDDIFAKAEREVRRETQAAAPPYVESRVRAAVSSRGPGAFGLTWVERLWPFQRSASWGMRMAWGVATAALLIVGLSPVLFLSTDRFPIPEGVRSFLGSTGNPSNALLATEDGRVLSIGPLSSNPADSSTERSADFIRIQTADGRIVTYGPLRDVMVKAGENITRGQAIGKLGSPSAAKDR